MTSGHGIAHGERSLPGDGSPLHGVQLWVALPEEHRHQAPHLEHHERLPTRTVGGVRTTVLLGSHDGMTSPAATYSPIVGVELRAAPGLLRLELRADFEHALLVDVTEDATLMLLGGEPFGERLVMWWTFVGRSHDDVVRAREQWQDRDPQDGGDGADRSGRFGEVPGWEDVPWLRAPELPNVRLRPRS